MIVTMSDPVDPMPIGPAAEPRGAALALDLGGSRLRAALVDAASGACWGLRWEASEQAGPLAVVEQMRRLLAGIESELAIARDAGAAPDWLPGPDTIASLPLGVAAPGPLDPQTGIMHALPNLQGWSGFPLRTALEEATGRRVRLHNDASLAALGEAWHGAGQGADPLLYLTLSTGIGGGLVVGRRIFGGAAGLAGELGHLIIRDGGPRCGLGHAGCAEGIASGSAIARRAQQLLRDLGIATDKGQGEFELKRDPQAAQAARDAGLGRLYRLATIKDEVMDAADVAAAARAGDSACQALLADAGRTIGLAIAAGINAFDPARVVLGGGLMRAWDLLEAPLRAALEETVLVWEARKIELRPAALGDRSGLVGAGLLAVAPEESR
jgi:glucokinase